MNRRKWSLALGLAFVGVTALMIGQTTMAGVEDSKHDFTGMGGSFSSTDICGSCHTPHGAPTGNLPLWDQSATSTTFIPYVGFDLDAKDSGDIAAVTSAAVGSFLCLSCHDGTINIDAGGVMMGTINSGAAVVANTNTSHPVNFTYNAALVTADGELNSPGDDTPNTGEVIDDWLEGADGSGKVQCMTCHDVHDALTIPKLLRTSNANSALCTTCHIK